VAVDLWEASQVHEWADWHECGLGCAADFQRGYWPAGLSTFRLLTDNHNEQRKTMTRNELNSALCAVLTTALETEPRPFPQSMAYLALGSDMGKWEMVRNVLTVGGLATMEGDTINLTAKGRDMARKVEAHIQALKQAD
jgi:hypothetical protein